MTITDLVECELVNLDEQNQIFGGARAYTHTNTYADESFAYGEAGAVALGNATITQAKVSTNTYKRNDLSLNYSLGSAQAKAKNKNRYALSTSNSSSVWASQS